MVKLSAAIVFMLLCIAKLSAAPLMEASVDSSRSFANYPLEGTLTITHGKDEKIDDHSFELEGKSLNTLFVKDVPFSSNTLITIYSFQLPPQEKGLYVLPAISAKINDQLYRSTPSTYEVTGTEGKPQVPSRTTTKKDSDQSPMIFRLDATIKGPSTLFPGQRTFLFYKISYNRSVDLSRSELPFIHPVHFKKIGDVQIRDSQQGEITVQDLSQEIEASELGSFELGPSIIEGYTYTIDLSGKKVYDSSLLRAEAPSITLQVKPFPKENQPASFTGAIGAIEAKIQLNSSSKLSVGDNMLLTVSLKGVSNLGELRLPSLACQPGFSGFFQLSDLPPPAEVDQTEKTKNFHVELRPLTAFVHEVPALQLSSFDPTSGKYIVQTTEPIPLSVSSPPMEKLIPSKTSPQNFPSIEQWPQPKRTPSEFNFHRPEMTEVHQNWLQNGWVVWSLPFGIGLLMLQRKWQRRLLSRPKPPIVQSEILLQKALQAPPSSHEAIHGLEQALWARLVEKGKLTPGGFHLEKIPLEGALKNVHTILYELQVLQYSPDKMYDLKMLQQQTVQIMETLT